METFTFDTEIEIANRTVLNSGLLLESATMDYYHKMEQETHTEYMVEATARNIFDRIGHFFVNIIQAMRRFGVSIKEQVSAKLRTREMKRAVRGLHVKAEELLKIGKKTMEMPAFDEQSRVLESYANRLRKCCKKIVANEYKSTRKMDEDLEKFRALYEEAERAFNEVSEKKVERPVKEVIKWVENQINGMDHTMTILDESLKDLEEMDREVRRMHEKRTLYGADILPAHVGLIRRTITKFSNFIHNAIGKRMAKIISFAVFACA